MSKPEHPITVKGKPVKYAVEIGAGDSYSTQLASLAGAHIERVDLYEPNPVLFKDLLAAYGGKPAVLGLAEAAVSDVLYTGTLFVMGYASYLAGVPSFLQTSVEEGADTIHWAPLQTAVHVVDMGLIDNGWIDLLVLTANGSEMAVLNRMVSRPLLIRTKSYLHNARQWEEHNKMVAWMRDQRYEPHVLESNTYSTFFHIDWLRL